MTSKLQPIVKIPKKGNGQFASRHPHSLSRSISLAPHRHHRRLRHRLPRRIYLPLIPGPCCGELVPKCQWFCPSRVCASSITSGQNFQVNQQYLYAAFREENSLFLRGKGLRIGTRARATALATLVPIVPPHFLPRLIDFDRFPPILPPMSQDREQWHTQSASKVALKLLP